MIKKTQLKWYIGRLNSMLDTKWEIEKMCESTRQTLVALRNTFKKELNEK